MTQTDFTGPDHRSRLLTLVFTDLSDSIGLKTRLGDTEAGRLISAHHAGIREISKETEGREILVAGDGCFLTFETPSRAVEFALRLQDFHRQNPSLPNVRVGIHMGEVTEKLSVSPQGRLVEVDGLAVDIASRIQSLAHPRQILMSYTVFDNARQRLDNSRISLPVEWRAHGRYIFRGTDLALEIFETGLKGVAAFTPPSETAKAHRDVNIDEEDTLGWRPAQGLELPGRTNWVLTEKLGEGGFGDVWLAEHRKTRDRHVIKFCYSPDRLRALKREVTLFRLLRETLGDRPDIARVLDYQFDTTPYYLEMEYAGRHNLTSWMQQQGGVLNIPLDTRLELAAQVTEAIAAAHSVGVLHKDIKPSNIMVTENQSSLPRVRLIDFGIGTVADRNLLDEKGITATGLTEVESSPEHASSLTGTRLYMAPELIEGKPATVKSDIYSLGVLLYQLASGNMGQALSFGWERDIPDEILRLDIKVCVDGRPENRIASAEELAKRLRTLPERSAAWEAARWKSARQAVARKRRRLIYAASGLLLVLVIVIGQYARMQMQRAESEEQLRKNAEAARKEAQLLTRQSVQALQEARQAQYFGTIALAEASLRESRFDKVQEVLFHEAPRDYLQREWGWLLAQTSPEDFAMKYLDIFDAVFSPDGERIITGDRDKQGLGYISIYNARSSALLAKIQTNVRLVWNIAVSPDGRYAATASSDNVVTVVDLSTTSVSHQLTNNTGIVRDVAFSPDGRFLASCSRDKTIRFWTTNDFVQKHAVRVEDESFTEISFSPDSRYLVSGSLEGNVRVFEVDSGAQVAMLKGHEDRVLSVAFLKNGTGIVTACKDGSTRLFEWPPPPHSIELEEALSFRSRSSYPAQVVSSTDGSFVYVGADNGRISKLDAKTGIELQNLQVDQPLWKMSLCSEGNHLLTTARWSMRMLNLDRLDAKSQVSAWNNSTTVPASAVRIRAATVANVRDQTWNADQSWFTTSGMSLVKAQSGQQFIVHSAYDIYSPDCSQHIKIDSTSLTATARTTSDNTVLWQSENQQILGARFSPDGKLAAIMVEDLGVTVFDTANWQLKYTLGIGKIPPVSLVYTPDGRELIVSYLTGVIESYNTATGSVVKRLYSRRAGAALSLDVSKDGRYLAAGLDVDKAFVIDLASGDQLSTMTGHVRYVHGVKFLSNSTRLATLSRDGTVKLWDTTTGRELVTLFHLEGNIVPLGIAFEENGRHIHIATSDRQIVTTDVFPWSLEAYGNEDYPLEDRVELWKRSNRLQKKLNMKDVLMPKEAVVGPPGLEPGTSRL